MSKYEMGIQVPVGGTLKQHVDVLFDYLDNIGLEKEQIQVAYINCLHTLPVQCSASLLVAFC